MLLPSDICWHYIGALQSNKLRELGTVRNLHTVETLDDAQKAVKLDRLWAGKEVGQRLAVFIQVNTSDEPQKGGVDPADAPDLARHVIQHCPRLDFRGLMTIGSYQSSCQSDNPDFVRLAECREAVASALGAAAESLELSMGMSHDYLSAVRFAHRDVPDGPSHPIAF